MTEAQIENKVCAMTDRLDERYMGGGMTEETYRERLREIDAWAEAALADRQRDPAGDPAQIRLSL